MIVLDTSGLIASIDEAEPLHAEARSALERDRGPFVLSPFVLAEADYLIGSRYGLRMEAALLREVADGVYRLAEFDRDDVGEAARLVAEYGELRIGLADASVVLLAARHSTDRILTLDERHFRAIRPLRGRAFTLLPADA